MLIPVSSELDSDQPCASRCTPEIAKEQKNRLIAIFSNAVRADWTS